MRKQYLAWQKPAVQMRHPPLDLRRFERPQLWFAHLKEQKQLYPHDRRERP